jgi:4-amino-4-deoxy-L-arabinose transferase-like glycosyltransferase
MPASNEILHMLLLVAKAAGLLVIYGMVTFGYGRGMLALLKSNPEDRFERTVFSLGLGAGVLAHGMILLGALGLLYPAAGWFLAAGGLFLSVYFVRGEVLSGARCEHPIRFSIFTWIMIAITAINLILPFLSDALTPPYTNDEIAYHLPIPKMYNQAHQFTYISFIPYANWTLEAEMLFGFGLLLGSEILAHLVSWSAVLVTTLGLYGFTRRYAGEKSGALAAALFTSTPMVQVLAGLALVEPVLTLFTFLSFISFVRWMVQKDRSWILSAIFAGLAAATKFNAVLIPVSFGLILFVVLMIDRPKACLKHARLFVLYGVLALVVVSPWYLKSWIQTGSPFWSFLPQVFPSRGWDALGSEYLIGFIKLPDQPVNLFNWFRLFGMISLNPGPFGGVRMSLGVYPLIFIPFWIAGFFLAPQPVKKVFRVSFLAAVLLYSAWFFTTHQSRFLTPAVPIFAFLSSAGLFYVLEKLPGRLGAVILAVVSLFLIATSWVFDTRDSAHLRMSVPYLLGQETLEQFVIQKNPGYDAVFYANRVLPQDAYVLMGLYEVRGYYLERDYFWANPVAQRVFPFETSPTPDDLAQRLKESGFTHVLYNTRTIRMFDDIRYGKQNADMFQAFLEKYCSLMYDAGVLQLYEIEQ